MMNLYDVKGLIFNIQRFSIHDGPGIRTSVFLKGCPLSCAWCHNPESVEASAEIGYYAGKCRLCEGCAAACPAGKHALSGEGHVFERDGCLRCGQCAGACPYDALAVIGKWITAGDALSEVKRDEPFYISSGGGMTVTGGEPFFQPEFTLALLKIAKENGLHTCVETSGAASFDTLKKAAEYTDLFLYDVKETDSKRHLEYVGIPNEHILSNLDKLDATGAAIELRFPIVPGINDYEAHFRKLGELTERLANVAQASVGPYHPLGISKSEAIGKAARHADRSIPSEEQVERWIEAIQKHTSKRVVKS